MKILLILLILMYSAFGKATEFSGHCQTKFRVHKESTDHRENLLVLDIAIEFLEGSKMLFFVEGSIHRDEKAYIISRYMTFSYANEGETEDENLYILKKLSVQKLHMDNVPDDNFTEQFGIYTDRPIFRISKIHNQYLFANQFSPIFICTTI